MSTQNSSRATVSWEIQQIVAPSQDMVGVYADDGREQEVPVHLWALVKDSATGRSFVAGIDAHGEQPEFFESSQRFQRYQAPSDKGFD